MGHVARMGEMRNAYDILVRMGDGLDDWDSRVRFRAVAGNFSLHHSLPNGSGAHPTSCRKGIKR
jgi:hypothetical protein